MADSTIGNLPAASAVGASDLFVLEQTGAAKKLTGQTLESWLLSMADGHGGISSITWTTSGTSGNGQYHYATIHYADTTTSTFTVRDGFKGDTGDDWYIWIKYASDLPTADADMSIYPDNYIGIYSGTSSSAPAHYTDYTWYQWKGEASYVWIAYSDYEPADALDHEIYYVPTSNTKSIGTYNGTEANRTVLFASQYNWENHTTSGGNLSPTGVRAGTYGPENTYATRNIPVPRMTVDEFGRITYATSVGFPLYNRTYRTIAAGGTSATISSLILADSFPAVNVHCYEITSNTKTANLTPVDFTYTIGSSSGSFPASSGDYFTVYVTLSATHANPVVVVVDGNFACITH